MNVPTKEFTECQAFCPIIRIGSPPSPQPQASVAPPLWVQGRDTLAGEGWGGHNSDERKEPLALCVYYNASTELGGVAGGV
jgi:hypothetical protein